MADGVREGKSWKWNEHEDAALDELHDARAEKLYLRGLRKHMDYGTGVVGLQRKVSYQMFSELLQELPTPGSRKKAYRPSLDAMRWMLDRLEEVGLIVRLPKKRRIDPMVFKLPLASTGLVCLQEQHQRNTKRAAPKESPDVARLDGYRNTKGTPKEEPHTSGISGNNNNTLSPISLTYTLKESGWEFGDQQIGVVRSLRPDLLADALLIAEKFRLYFTATGDRLEDWDARFAKWVLDEKPLS